MLSSARDAEIAVRGFHSNIAAYLMKPVKQMELLRAIHLALTEKLSAAPARTRTSGESGLVQTEDSAPPVQNLFLQELHVLLAEDNPINQKVAIRMLREAGIQVTLASNGLEAVAALTDGAFDLILMDVQMPEMDGLEATRQIRSQEQATGRHTPVVAMTAHVMKGDRERCLAAGMDGYVSKPVRLDELRRAIVAVLPEASVAAPSGSISAPQPSAKGADHDEPQPAEWIVLPPGPPCDWNAALAEVNGNEKFMREIAAMLLEDAPPLIDEIRTAIEVKDATRLTKAVHRLKGSLNPFMAYQALELTQRLEDCGSFGKLSEAEHEFYLLQQETHRLFESLTSIVSPDKRVTCPT